MTVLGGDMARAQGRGDAPAHAARAALRLLRRGDRHDRRQAGPAAANADAVEPRATGVGFTTGTPWEAPQPDSLATNVALQDADSGSLLNLYRRLIHLRKHERGSGDAAAGAARGDSPHVVAYLRRAGDRAVLVVANLGDAAVSGIAIGSAAGALPTGSYTTRNLMGGPNGAALRVGQDGRIQGYIPVATIGARQSFVLDLVRQ